MFMTEVVGVNISEIDSCIWLAGPASAINIDFLANIFFAIPARTHKNFQVAILLWEINVHLSNDIGLTQFFVGRLQERTPSVIITVYQVIGSKEVGFTPDNLLFTQPHAHAIADGKVNKQLPDISLVIQFASYFFVVI